MQAVAFLTAQGGCGKPGLLVHFPHLPLQQHFFPNGSSCSGGEAGGIWEALAVI